MVKNESAEKSRSFDREVGNYHMIEGVWSDADVRIPAIGSPIPTRDHQNTSGPIQREIKNIIQEFFQIFKIYPRKIQFMKVEFI